MEEESKLENARPPASESVRRSLFVACVGGAVGAILSGVFAYFNTAQQIDAANVSHVRELSLLEEQMRNESITNAETLAVMRKHIDEIRGARKDEKNRFIREMGLMEARHRAEMEVFKSSISQVTEQQASLNADSKKHLEERERQAAQQLTRLREAEYQRRATMFWAAAREFLDATCTEIKGTTTPIETVSPDGNLRGFSLYQSSSSFDCSPRETAITSFYIAKADYENARNLLLDEDQTYRDLIGRVEHLMELTELITVVSDDSGKGMRIIYFDLVDEEKFNEALSSITIKQTQ